MEKRKRGIYKLVARTKVYLRFRIEHNMNIAIHPTLDKSKFRPYNEVTAKACEDARNGISAGRVDTSSFEAFLRSVLDE